jgi:hypothetical protein
MSIENESTLCFDDDTWGVVRRKQTPFAVAPGLAQVVKPATQGSAFGMLIGLRT